MNQSRRKLCTLRASLLPALPPDLPAAQLRAIVRGRTKWANGTELHYCFLDGSEKDRTVVQHAFQHWKDVGIGLTFHEVEQAAEAEIRIGFKAGDGSWSYIGRENLKVPKTDRTMNFGWPLAGRDGADTALHEIGHALGLSHEHQNPLAGIVWNEDAVYAAHAEPPNEWDRSTTYANIIRKLDAADIEGTDWDPDSIMHYPFDPGLIISPDAYANGLLPRGGLSERDHRCIRASYPPLERGADLELCLDQPLPLQLASSTQANLLLRPATTRRYKIATAGASDLVLVLFKMIGDKPRMIAGDDDSAQTRNATLNVTMEADQTYVLRVRLFYAENESDVAITWS